MNVMFMKSKYIQVLVVALMLISTAAAQDPHFSQYFSSPLTMNPANTGNFDGPSRLATNFRNQWAGIGEPFLTGTVSFDTEIFKDKIGNGNKLAVGVLGLYDKSSGGRLKSSYLGASVGYHLWLDRDKMKKLSIGFQATAVNRHLDYQNVTFADQFGSYGFDLNLPSNQTFQSGNIGYVDFNTGLMYTNDFETGTMYAGVSMYHILQPKESFLGNEKNRVSSRFTFHTGANWNVGEKGEIHGSALLMQQGTSTEFALGLAYGKNIPSESNDITVYIGSWMRNKDAVIPYMGYKFNNLQLGITYDATISTLNSASTKNRSFEVAVIYHFLDKTEYRRFVPWY